MQKNKHFAKFISEKLDCHVEPCTHMILYGCTVILCSVVVSIQAGNLGWIAQLAACLIWQETFNTFKTFNIFSKINLPDMANSKGLILVQLLILTEKYTECIE